MSYSIFYRIFATFFAPACFVYAGYQLTGTQGGGLAGLVAYSGLLTLSVAARVGQRQDYWASKSAKLKAEAKALRGALAEEHAKRASGTLAEDNQVIIDAYRSRLAVLQISTTALRAGYSSYKSAPLGHFSEKKGGLLPDGKAQ